MNIIEGEIPGLLIIAPDIYFDDRGYFFESYNEEKLALAGFPFRFVQDNESCSKKGVIRALHFQHPPYEQGKLVRVVSGNIIDVAVDIRKGSPWYGKYQKVFLSAENKKQFWVPSGFAHGFAAMDENTIVSYKCTSHYHKASEDSIIWSDPDLNIDWGVKTPVVSDRDAEAQRFSTFESKFIYSV
ncbi:MAG: dTDP-4-dehydrorhamnose 3,5-epimerase [Bacteroidales bacterium]|nr:dTDP-4-dehydrorhamnose 3,5-epimerase [Bacteroidales bacterium]